jgi:hypothetical protein
MTDNSIEHKKRGRKPKNYINRNITNQTINENINSEEEKIIYHLQLNPDNINKTNINDIFINNFESNNIQSNDNLINKNTITETDMLNSTIMNNNINKIMIHTIKTNDNTRCWWCKNNFNTISIQLPENYIEGTFFCIGNFCSYNCAKSYNLDLNDVLTYKRNSLLNFLYYLTYSEYKNIISAPHWLSLEEYGGFLSIDNFRKNFIFNNKEFLLLHPPIVSRQFQIEESYKLNKLSENPINKINKLYSDIDTDIKNNFNLEESMGLIKC